MLKRIAVSLIFAMVVFQLTAPAQGFDVPVEEQVSIFRKLFNYDKALKGTINPRMLVVHHEKKATARISELFKDTGFTVESVTPGELKARISSDISVIYVFPEAYSEDVRNACISNSVLSISGSAGLVRDGKVSIGLALRNSKKVDIFISKKQVAAEGHMFSSSLLKVVTLLD